MQRALARQPGAFSGKHLSVAARACERKRGPDGGGWWSHVMTPVLVLASVPSRNRGQLLDQRPLPCPAVSPGQARGLWFQRLKRSTQQRLRGLQMVWRRKERWVGSGVLGAGARLLRLYHTCSSCTVTDHRAQYTYVTVQHMYWGRVGACMQRRQRLRMHGSRWGMSRARPHAWRATAEAGVGGARAPPGARGARLPDGQQLDWWRPPC